MLILLYTVINHEIKEFTYKYNTHQTHWRRVQLPDPCGPNTPRWYSMFHVPGTPRMDHWKTYTAQSRMLWLLCPKLHIQPSPNTILIYLTTLKMETEIKIGINKCYQGYLVISARTYFCVSSSHCKEHKQSEDNGSSGYFCSHSWWVKFLC